MTPASNVPRRKLNRVNRELGNRRIARQQDTTRVLFDTIPAGFVGTQFEFFRDFNKTRFECNIDQNRLDSQESMVVNNIILLDGQASNTFLQNARLNFKIGNDVRIKDYNLAYDASVGFGHHPISNSSAEVVGIPLITSIVIPPDVSFSVTLETGAAALPEGTRIVLQGFGKIFKPGNSF